MKARLLLGLLVAGLLCSCCTTTDTSTRTQQTVLPQQSPQTSAPLRPGHN
jgi:hypothetical protein